MKTASSKVPLLRITGQSEAKGMGRSPGHAGSEKACTSGQCCGVPHRLCRAVVSPGKMSQKHEPWPLPLFIHGSRWVTCMGHGSPSPPNLYLSLSVALATQVLLDATCHIFSSFCSYSTQQTASYVTGLLNDFFNDCFSQITTIAQVYCEHKWVKENKLPIILLDRNTQC